MGPGSYTKNYTELRNVKSGRNSSSQGKASKLVKQYLVASPENIYIASNIIWTKQAAFICVCYDN